MTAYQVGEIVDITIRGARIDAVTDDRLAIVYGTGRWFARLAADDVTVIRVTPADGEPQAGDIWADRNSIEYYATQSSNISTVRLTPANGQSNDWPDVNRFAGPLRLVYRPAPPAEGEVAS